MMDAMYRVVPVLMLVSAATMLAARLFFRKPGVPYWAS